MLVIQIGELIEGVAERDAIHVAVAPVEVGAIALSPGWHVCLRDGKAVICGEPVGIVDPFLKKDVQPGERFWLFLYPNTVTEMRHHWSHPAFSDAPVSDLSLSAAELVAKKCGKTYEALMEDAMQFHNGDEWIYDNSERYKDVSQEEWLRFWEHFEAVTNEHASIVGAPYTCSC